MNKKATLLAALLALGLQQTYGIELKENVCVVKQNAGDSLLKAYEDVAKELSTNGYFAASRSMRRKGKGFGSGIVYKAKDGKHYILTNHHVVGSMDYVDLEFEQANGEKKTYTQCKVKGHTTEDDQDVALVDLPDTLKFGELIAAHTGDLKDGEEVWTAGFPGLGNQPIWQLGKGIISNTIAKPEGYKNGTLIQHTAQVDAGNSGGPLLKKVQKTTGTGKKKKTVETYEVIGLNTWKARFRENTNYSIPFDVAKHFADSVAALPPAAQGTGLRQTMENFIENLKASDIDKTAEQLSNMLVMKTAMATLSDKIKQADNKTQQALRDGQAEEGLRRLTAIFITNSYAWKKNTLSVMEVGDTTATEGTASFIYNKKTVATHWKRIDGTWRLEGIDDFKAEKMNAKAEHYVDRDGYHIDKPTYRRGFDVGYGLSTKMGGDRMTSIRYFGSRRFFTWHISFSMEKAKYAGVDSTKKEYWEDQIGKKLTYTALGGGVALQLPVALNQWQVVPTVGVDGIGTLTDGDKQADGSDLVLMVYGAKIGYMLKSGNMPYVQIDYNKPFVNSDEDSPQYQNFPSWLMVRLGFAF